MCDLHLAMSFSKVITVILSIFLFDPYFSSGVTVRFKQRPDRFIFLNNDLEDERHNWVAASLAHCAVLCASTPGCISAAFSHTKMGRCRGSSLESVTLAGQAAIFNHPEDNTTSKDGKDRSGLTLLEYPVYTTGEPKSLTFDQARDACTAVYGTELASEMELIEAGAAGFESCECGWISDGSNGLLVHDPDSPCVVDYTYTPGVTTCNLQYAMAFCKP